MAKVTKKSKKNVAKKSLKRKEKKTIETDKFGNRVGSNRAKFNAVLSKKPKKMAELVKEAKLSGTFYEHVNTLIDAGHVEKTDKKYKLN